MLAAPSPACSSGANPGRRNRPCRAALVDSPGFLYHRPMRSLRRPAALLGLVALTACSVPGPAPADDTTASVETGSTAADPPTSSMDPPTSSMDPPTSSTDPPTSSTDGTTSDASDPCTCDTPVIHDGPLDAEDLAGYQGACLVEVTGSLWIEDLTD